MEYLRGLTGHNNKQKKRKFTIERLRLVNESFNNIKSIKLFGYEDKFLSHINSIHKQELEIAKETFLTGEFFHFLVTSID